MAGKIFTREETRAALKQFLQAAATPVINEEDIKSPLVDTLDPKVDIEGDEMPTDEPEDGEELITEIPVHGVATIEGAPTGDGRGFRPGSLSFGTLPQPLGFEFESGHGSDNSKVAIVGRIDTFEVVETDKGYSEARWTGVIMPHKPYAAQALDGIIDKSYRGVSVIVDSVTYDVSEERERMLARINAPIEDKAIEEMTPEEIDAFVTEMVGDGETEVTWFSKVRIRRFDMVPTGAFIEGYTDLGHEWLEDLTPDQIEASAAALADCGCTDGKFALEFDSRSDEGPLYVGPFDSVEDANDYAAALGRSAMATAGFWDASFEVREFDSPALLASAVSPFAPGTKDGPGWITHPIATSRIRRYWVSGKGAAKINWGTPGDFNRCRMQLAKYVQNPEWLAGLCANLHKEALGVWPGQEAAGGRHSLMASASTADAAPLFAIVASAEPIDADYFMNPMLETPTGLTVDGDRVYGHIAAWNVCHIGQPEGPGSCTMAPRSSTDYAHFRTGTVVTTAGKLAVGRITMGIGHAGDRASALSAASHYDNTGAVVADIATGEDNWGIWFSGRIRPSATDQQRYELEASGRLSGDWREIGGNYELVAALAVNVPGFPIPKMSLVASADLGITAIIAAGMIDPEAPAPKLEALELTSENVAGIAIAAVETYVMHQERAALAEELRPARDALLKLALRNARANLERISG